MKPNLQHQVEVTTGHSFVLFMDLRHDMMISSSVPSSWLELLENESNKKADAL